MKIALVGSAPSSVQKAPIGDSTWEIWGCSPGAAPMLPKADLWFEMHKMEPGKPCTAPQYIDIIKGFACPVLMVEPIEEIPYATRYPIEDMLKKFGPYCWTSTLSYMMAFAISRKPQEIAFFGVDMSANEEYAQQRPALHFLIHEAQRRGIKVSAPLESDLLRPSPMYGYREFDPLFIKSEVREREISQRLREAEAQMEQAREHVIFLRGALDDISYVKRTWPHRRDQIDLVENPIADLVGIEDAAFDHANEALATAMGYAPVAPTNGYHDPYIQRVES